MGVLNVNLVLATSDTHLEFVDRLLTIVFADHGYPITDPKGMVPITMFKNHSMGTMTTCRHALHWYENIFKWWTRLRAVDVESKLPELVRVATVGFDDLPTNNSQSCGPWLMDRGSPYQPDAKASKPSLAGNTYVVLALLVMASGARAPPELRDAFVKAAECEAQNILDRSGDPGCEAHVARRKLVALIEKHDFESGTRRLFLREPLSPDDHQLTAMVNDTDPPMPWFPVGGNRYPIVICDVPPSEPSPWINTPTVRMFLLVNEKASPALDRHPGAAMLGRDVKIAGTRDDDLNDKLGIMVEVDLKKDRYKVELPQPASKSRVVSLRPACVRVVRYAPPPLVVADAAPTLDGVAIYAFGDAPPSRSSTKKQWQSQQTCAVCGAKGKLFKCAKCKRVSYCGAACQTTHWKDHRKQCKAHLKSDARMKEHMSAELSKLKNIPFDEWGTSRATTPFT